MVLGCAACRADGADGAAATHDVCVISRGCREAAAGI